MSWLSRIAHAFRSSRLDRDLDDELRFHLEAREQANVHKGASRDDAAAAARRRFGSTLRLREESRDVRLLPWLESLLQDIRYSWRALRKSPAMTASAIVSLSLAMGACVAAFALLDALVLRPLPVRDPARLILLTYPSRTPGGPDADTFTGPLFERFRADSSNHADLFAADEGAPRTVAFDSSEERVWTQSVSGTAFRILGLQSGDQPSAVLSHAYWTRRFAADPAVVGRSIRIGAESYKITGVAPRGFTGLEPGTSFDVWLPIPARADNLTRLRVFGRLKPGVAAAQAREVLQPAFTGFRRDYARGYFRPEASRDEVAAYINARLNARSAATGLSRLREQFERPLWILALIAGLVLCICCSNVANLFTARAAARERELALRASIGAGRGRLIQQVLVEGCLLAAISCAFGLAIARTAAPAIVSRLTPTDYPAYLDLRFDWRLAAFILGLELIAVLLFSLIPALRAGGAAPGLALKSGGGHSAKSAVFRPIMAVQVAFSFVVLFVASLLLNSYHKLTSVDLGFSPDGVVLVTLNDTRNDTRNPSEFQHAGPALVDRIRSLPGVQSAALSWWPLLGGDFQPVMRPAVRIPGHETVTRGPVFLAVGPGFFETMRIGLVEGRDFHGRDSGSSSAVLVNQTFARRYLPAGGAVGRRFARAADGGRFVDQEIVGVVRDSRYKNVFEEPLPMVFFPLPFLNGTTLQVRTASDPAQLASILRREIPLAHPSLRVSEVALQSTRIENTLLRQRLLALLSGFFAVVALVLAAVGLYGVLSYSVVRRTKELGIRVALGARRTAVVRLVIGDIALAMALGLAAGLAASLAASRFVTTLLYDVEPTGFWSIAAPLACFLAAGTLVAVGPALRAARTDPLLALRCE